MAVVMGLSRQGKRGLVAQLMGIAVAEAIGRVSVLFNQVEYVIKIFA